MGFGAKPRWVGNEGEALPYSPELAVSECSQLSEGLGAKLWCVKGITILKIPKNTKKIPKSSLLS